MTYQEINSETIDRWVDGGWEWSRPIDHATYEKACAGDWSVLLTPLTPVPASWFGEIKGKKLLGLACGGGQQMPIFHAAGAECTVLDNSAKMLDRDREVQQREGYTIEIIQGDMTKPLPFADESFDIIFHPVSNCYVEKVLPIWQECYRVLKPGGRLLSGFDYFLSYLLDDDGNLRFHMPFNPLKNEEQMEYLKKDDGGVQFSHTLTEQIGGQVKAGFILADMFEDTGNEGPLYTHNVPEFIATLAIKPS